LKQKQIACFGKNSLFRKQVWTGLKVAESNTEQVSFWPRFISWKSVTDDDSRWQRVPSCRRCAADGSFADGVLL